MTKFLIIQTAFIGDVILATGIVEKLHLHFPDAQIDFMLRKGNESLLKAHPILKNLYVWDKKDKKYSNLREIIRSVRKERYDYVINLQRFGSTGYLTWRSRANTKIGFNKNPFSFSFNKKVEHKIGDGTHEVERNQKLIEELTDQEYSPPRLYPSDNDFSKVSKLKVDEFICIAPASVWFTKQYPREKWLELIEKLKKNYKIYLLGGPDDMKLCELICVESESENLVNLAGELSLLESAALMKDAAMSYVNDSAPMHLCSSMNAKTTAIFCSTVPAFGFGPLSENSKIVEIEYALKCRPCGIHGKSECPKGHFECAQGIKTDQLF